MSNKEMYYREGMGSWIMLTNLYLEHIGWVWDRDEMDYVTDDIDLVHYTLLVESYIADICFGIDEDAIVNKVLTICDYNDEEELSKAIKEQLSMCLDQGLAELGDYIKEEVRRAFLCSRVYEDIKHKAGRQVKTLNLADKIYMGITNTEWAGTRSEFTDILRRGLEVTFLRVKKRSKKRSYMNWMVPAVNIEIKKELYKNGYTVEQVETMVKKLGNEITDLVSERRLACDDWGIDLKVLIVPKGLKGFDVDDRVYILPGDTYHYLQSKNVVYLT